MNIQNELEAKVGITNSIYLNNIEIDPLTIKAIMINEVVPSDALQDFYGVPDADYLKTTIPLFQGAGAEVKSIQDILQMGIYITNAVKTPKTKYAIETALELNGEIVSCDSMQCYKYCLLYTSDAADE